MAWYDLLYDPLKGLAPIYEVKKVLSWFKYDLI